MTRRIALPFTIAATALLAIPAGAIAAGETTTPAGPDFIKEVKPILENECVRCHGADKTKGKLRLDTREHFLKGGDTDVAVEPGNAEHSLLYERLILPKGDDELMPQETDPLTAEEIAIVKSWIDAGAHWPEDVTLKPPKKRAEFADSSVLNPDGPPKSPQEAGARLDRIIEHENAQNPHLPKEVAAPIDDLTFLRRVTIDLIGRIPTYKEIREYEKLPTGTRRALTVDKLLEHPRFVDRWSVFMSDMLRIRTNVEGGGQFLAYVRKSLADEKPYDVLAKELVSANGKASKVPAVGFVLGDNVNPMSLAGATAQIFLGVQLACAECHDHPFDDWEQMEFYEFASYFGKTQRVQSRFTRSVYTTEGKQNTVLWPPERENPETRSPVKPRFPFELKQFDEKPDYIIRLEAKRAAELAAVEGKKEDKTVDNLLDIDTTENTRDLVPANIDVLKEVKKESRDLKVINDLYRASELRNELAELITNPRNPYFGPAFVNRVWAELNGSGFVEPLDNFSAYNAASHPMALDFLAREFIASGYDIRELIRIITLSDTYRRGHNISGKALDIAEREDAERNFIVAKARRMISEVLYDSIVIAGHLEQPKWKAGENIRTITRQIRVPIEEEMKEEPETPETPVSTAETEPKMEMAMAPKKPAMNGGGYDLEQTIALNFDEILKRQDEEAQDAAMMKKMADDELKRIAEMAAMREQQRQNAPPMRYELKTIEEKTDDNPSFNSTMQMASPAPPEHFLRVFGQPARQDLGDFRDPSASLRQQLMMINGRATDKASRVGTLEPIYPLIVGPKADLTKAIRLAYLQILTREPSADEVAEAKMIVGDAGDDLTGMSDLRWILLNCHEFRFTP